MEFGYILTLTLVLALKAALRVVCRRQISYSFLSDVSLVYHTSSGLCCQVSKFADNQLFRLHLNVRRELATADIMTPLFVFVIFIFIHDATTYCVCARSNFVSWGCCKICHEMPYYGILVNL